MGVRAQAVRVVDQVADGLGNQVLDRLVLWCLC